MFHFFFKEKVEMWSRGKENIELIVAFKQIAFNKNRMDINMQSYKPEFLVLTKLLSIMTI